MNFQERLGALESEARGRIRRALSTGNAKLLELDGALAKVSEEGWGVTALGKQLEQLRARAQELRASALKRVQEMPGDAVCRIATGSRAPVQNLARGLARMAERFEAAPPRVVEHAGRDESRVAEAG